MASTAVAVAEPDEASFTFNPSAPEFIPTGSLFSSLPCSPALVPLGSKRGSRNRSLSFTDLAMMSPLLGPLAPLPAPFAAAALLESLPMSVAAGLRSEDDDVDGEDWSGSGRLYLVPREDDAQAVQGSAKSGSSTARRKSSSSRRSSAMSGVSDGQDKLECRRSSTRRSTNAAEIPSQVATLVIKNLSLDLEKEDVMRHLEEQDATAMDVELHRDAAGAFRGTAFARYESPGRARAAIDKLGTCPELGGRKARVEIQKSKALFGRKCLEAELPQEKLGAVREEIEAFVADADRTEVELSQGLSVHQRKYAHSLAERHNLVHATRQGDTGDKFVFLSKARPEPTDGRKKAHSVIYASMPRPSFSGATPEGAKATRRATAPTFGADGFALPLGFEANVAHCDELDPTSGVTVLMADQAATTDISADTNRASVEAVVNLVGAAPGLPPPLGLAPRPPGLELQGLPHVLPAAAVMMEEMPLLPEAA